MDVLTIGHSTRPVDEFIRLLRLHGVELVVDVRTIPKSAHNPQYNRDDLAASLAQVNIGYVHMKGLGGLRKPRHDSTNTAWHNESFRGYADYMQTAEFEENLERLLELAGKKRTAILCAEAVPWRCHRSLISDALAARGVKVRHVIDVAQTLEHHLTAWARVANGRVTYPGEDLPPKDRKGSG